MDFRADDPGAVQFGNFINYYHFNSAEERLKLLPNDVWIPGDNIENRQGSSLTYHILDVGCNSGVLTQLLYKYLKDITKSNVEILGVDIDPVLIQRANEENQFIENVSYLCCDVMKMQDFSTVLEYLDTKNTHRFNAVCCFSITMWIHLNHNDSGLKEFLSKCSHISDLYVVEPQPWKCYQTAVRRMKKAKEAFPLFPQLNWRSNVENDIQNYLETELNRRKIFETSPTKWKRKICFYR